MTALALYWLFLRAVLLSFSGFATVPLLRESLVIHQAVLTDAQLNDAIAISQASPGPLGLYVVVVGYFVAGLPGALAGVMALASPAFLAIPIARLVSRGRSALVRGASSGIVIASAALMLITGGKLALAAAPSSPYLVIIIVGAITVAATKIKPVWVIVAAGLFGLILR